MSCFYRNIAPNYIQSKGLFYKDAPFFGNIFSCNWLGFSIFRQKIGIFVYVEALFFDA